jgi:hypothetical protein
VPFSLEQNHLIFILHQEQQQPQPVFPHLHLGSIHSTPPDTRDSTPLPASTSQFPIESGSISTPGSIPTHSPYRAKIISALNIPLELTDHRDLDLGYAWKKYKACLVAITACNVLWDGNKLREIFDRKPTQADIISVFKGKTQWHLTYAKAFPKLSGYPEMVSWLEDSDEKLSDLELWGTVKSTYTFSDLLEWLANGGVGLRKMETDIGETQKGKEKEKEKEKRKGKGKEKEKEKRMEKGKGKTSEGGKKKNHRAEKL